MQEKGKKFDEDKPKVALLSSEALLGMAKVMTFGEKKYGSHNWRNGINLSRLISASLRHILKYNSGKDTDEETGINHLSHAMCCLMMAVEQQIYKPEFDDRYKSDSSL